MYYFFEKRQNLVVKVVKGENQIPIDTSLGEIMGAKGQILIKNMLNPYPEEIILQGRTIGSNNYSLYMTFSIFNEFLENESVFIVIKKLKNNVILLIRL